MNPLLLLLFLGFAPFLENAYVFPGTPTNLHLTLIDQNQYALAYQASSSQYLQFINSSGIITANLTAQGSLIENLCVNNYYLIYTSYSQSQLNLYAVLTYNQSNTTQIPLISNVPSTPKNIFIAPLPLNSSYIAISFSVNRFIGSFGYQKYTNLTSLKIPTGTQIYQALNIDIHTTAGVALSANRLAMIGYQGGIVTQNISTPGDMYSVFYVTNPNTKTTIYSSLIDQNSTKNAVYFQQLFQFPDSMNFAVLLSNSTIQLFSETLGKITNTISLGIAQNANNKCLPVDSDEFLAFFCLDYTNKQIIQFCQDVLRTINLYSNSNNFSAKKVVQLSSTILDFAIDAGQFLIVYATSSQVFSTSFTF